MSLDLWCRSHLTWARGQLLIGILQSRQTCCCLSSTIDNILCPVTLFWKITTKITMRECFMPHRLLSIKLYRIMCIPVQTLQVYVCMYTYVCMFRGFLLSLGLFGVYISQRYSHDIVFIQSIMLRAHNYVYALWLIYDWWFCYHYACRLCCSFLIIIMFIHPAFGSKRV